MAEGMTLEEQGAIAKTFLEGLVEAFGLTATVEVRTIDDETVELAVTAPSSGCSWDRRAPRSPPSRR